MSIAEDPATLEFLTNVPHAPAALPERGDGRYEVALAPCATPALAETCREADTKLVELRAAGSSLNSARLCRTTGPASAANKLSSLPLPTDLCQR